jgi:membrane associated rhomboid family serine protease
MNESRSNRLYGNILIAFGIVALLWAVHLIDLFLPMNLKSWGLVPRSVNSLPGIVAYPFLHGDFRHLISNSGTLFVLLAVSLSLSRIMTIEALVIIILLSGAGIWIFGAPNTIHIGASGVIFGLIGFLLFIGVFQKRWNTLLFSVIVFFAYGGVLWSLLSYQPGISWSGHFWGFVSGVAAAWWMRNEDYFS